MQLMAKHRLHEEIDSRLAEKLEREIGLQAAIGFVPHEPPRKRGAVVGVKSNAFVRRSSYRIWSSGLALFAIAAFGVIVTTLLSIFAPGLLVWPIH